MTGKKNIQWSRVMVRVLMIFCLIFLVALGVHYRPTQNFDYSSPANAVQTVNGLTKVNFDFLGGYRYEGEKDIPPTVKELDGKRVEIKGFMLPIDFDGAVVTSFMLMSTQAGCCFGVIPRDNEFVYAEFPKGKSTKFLIDVPLNVTGVLHIGRDTLVGGVYSMTVESVRKD